MIIWFFVVIYVLMPTYIATKMVHIYTTFIIIFLFFYYIKYYWFGDVEQLPVVHESIFSPVRIHHVVGGVCVIVFMLIHDNHA